MSKESKPRERKDHFPKTKLEMIYAKTKSVGKCREWLGAYFKGNGTGRAWEYPQIYFKSKKWRGNRLVWILTHGPITREQLVLHTCDNMRCLNPEHLYLGDQRQNVRDTIKRNRRNSPRGLNGQFTKGS